MSKKTASKAVLERSQAFAGLISTIQARFEKNIELHQGLSWSDVLQKIQKSPTALKNLQAMEETGGEPEVVIFDAKPEFIHFVDCAPESPLQRRSLCYDRAALDARKIAKPVGCAEELAAKIGIQLLDPTQYQALQSLGQRRFDQKTSSWLATPAEMRKLGGAMFGDHRFGQTFIYHNGAEAYYAARGFRGFFVL